MNAAQASQLGLDQIESKESAPGVAADLDPLLAPFFEDEEARADQHLDDVVRLHIRPVVQETVMRRFGWRPGRERPNEEDEDREDVAATALAAVVGVLREDRTIWRERPLSERPVPISDLRAYTRRAANNAFAKHLRNVHPGRWRAMQRISYVCKAQIGLSIQNDEGGSSLIRDSWGTDPPVADADRLTRMVLDPNAARAQAERTLGRNATTLPELLVLFLDWAGGPVPLSRLAATISTLLSLDRGRAVSTAPPDESEDELDVANPTPDPERVAQARAELAEIWIGIGRLHVRHRRALLLNLRDGGQISIVSLLPIAGIATIEEIAHTLEIPRDTFLQLWHELPWTDARIGEMIGRTAEQVVGLRSTARQSLAGPRRTL